jgi:glycosyl hydrolase family 18 (putative chitinase)
MVISFLLPKSKVRRTIILVGLVIVLELANWIFGPRGLDIFDGRHDRGHNAIWLQHGWLGDRSWFKKYNKLDKLSHFRDPERVRELAELLARHNIRDVFPHLCPARTDGRILPVDDQATEVFLDKFKGFRVMPWIGGVLSKNVILKDPRWRKTFVASIEKLLTAHPRLAGVHLNVEPCPSGNSNFLRLLDEIKEILPKGKVLSVAAYPPPTILHPYPQVHWDKSYFIKVAKRADQIAVMMYDTSIRFRMLYRHLMAEWTLEILRWSEGSQVLLGLPAYEDLRVEYHHADVENLTEALQGIHIGLTIFGQLPDNYQGTAIYSEWQMNDSKWQAFRKHFMKNVSE